MVFLSRFYNVGIASNIDPLFFSYIKGMCPEFECLSARVLSFDIGYLKPSKRFFEAMIRLTESMPYQHLLIDDDWIKVDFASTMRRLARYRGRVGIDADLYELMSSVTRSNL